MIFKQKKTANSSEVDALNQGKLEALDRSQAVIEFKPDGTILSANENFLATAGYALEEIVGQHHRIFVSPDYAQSSEYTAFWAKLARGDFESGQFLRYNKMGDVVWLQASYNPIKDVQGNVIRVVKFAQDITGQKSKDSYKNSILDAVDRTQATIEFNLDGTIRKANENFLATVGYRLDEIVGKHHRMFVLPDYATSNEYQNFWEKLRSGDFHSGKFERVGKSGNAIWLQAVYCPILGVDGKPEGVIKIASDITEQILAGKRDEQIHSLSSSIDHLSGSSTNISEAAEQLLNVAKNQSYQSSEVATAVEEMVQTILENAKSSTIASDEAQKSGDFAKEGAVIVNKTVNKSQQLVEVIQKATNIVNKLGESSEQIGDIVKVIAEIADQTNLLALNAAIEAARAGEMGKGFAVVADEVRKLAERSSESTGEISKMIFSIQAETEQVVMAMKEGEEEVREGLQLAREAGVALDKIVQSSSKMVDMITQIAAASEEQSVTSEHIAKSIEKISTAAEDTTAAVEGIAHIATELDSSSERMRQDVQQLIQ